MTARGGTAHQRRTTMHNSLLDQLEAQLNRLLAMYNAGLIWGSELEAGLRKYWAVQAEADRRRA
jgi:hypothetical protein